MSPAAVGLRTDAHRENMHTAVARVEISTATVVFVGPGP